MSRAALLRALLREKQPVVLAGAHSGLSAKLVESTGFDGIWASGFEISASFGLPDASLLTMTESLATVRTITQATHVPVVADCDNGYGNAVNVIRTVQEYERAEVAGICIEDNVFPKRCSFYEGVYRELETIEEFVGKIKAAKSAQRDPDFVIIARTEALIAGRGMEETLSRARAYADAGADLIMAHSKSSSPDEVLEFARTWDRPRPLVAVPTTYNSMNAASLFRNGFRLVIFANHGIRSAVRNMRAVLETLRRTGTSSSVDDQIASLDEIHSLVGLGELQAHEKQFLTRRPAPARADGSVNCSGRSMNGLGPLTGRPLHSAEPVACPQEAKLAAEEEPAIEEAAMQAKR